MLPFGLCNATETVGRLVVQRMVPTPANNEFVGVIEHVTESFHDILAKEPESPSSSNSSRGTHHPSHECFMVGTPEGYVESIHKGEATLMNDLDDKVEGDVGAPPHLWVEQLKA